MKDNNNCPGTCPTCKEECIYNAESATVTLSLDDGTEEECEVLTIFSAAGKKYVALLPLDENGENQDGEVYIYRFHVDEPNGEPQLENIEDDDEYEAAADGFDEWLDSQEYDELVFEESDE